MNLVSYSTLEPVGPALGRVDEEATGPVDHPGDVVVAVELVAPLLDRRHREPSSPRSPLRCSDIRCSLPASRSMSTQKLARTADDSSYALNPA
jgi:hypothetical protein